MWRVRDDGARPRARHGPASVVSCMARINYAHYVHAMYVHEIRCKVTAPQQLHWPRAHALVAALSHRASAVSAVPRVSVDATTSAVCIATERSTGTAKFDETWEGGSCREPPCALTTTSQDTREAHRHVATTATTRRPAFPSFVNFGPSHCRALPRNIVMSGQLGMHVMVELPRDALVGPRPLPLCSGAVGARQSRSWAGRGRLWNS